MKASHKHQLAPLKSSTPRYEDGPRLSRTRYQEELSFVTHAGTRWADGLAVARFSMPPRLPVVTITTLPIKTCEGRDGGREGEGVRGSEREGKVYRGGE